MSPAGNTSKCKPIQPCRFLKFVTALSQLCPEKFKTEQLKAEFFFVSEGNTRGFGWADSFSVPLAQSVSYPSPETRTQRWRSRSNTQTEEEGPRPEGKAEGLQCSSPKGLEIIPCTFTHRRDEADKAVYGCCSRRGAQSSLNDHGQP